ncbi:hypothetical protein HCN44_004806 [Aphidius gifuensis]|uniref:Uncharacterized protein n=1 Tax=Aphidius gifuensis TaxID=684658 RepID=A0A834XJH1_APHGI|nr:hypothetical protein HCN44_004806 [Aphidius gifuensis]
MINNEIPVNERVQENDKKTPVDGPVTENEIPADEVVVNNQIPVDGPVAENEIPVDVEKNDRANTVQEHETAAEMFANAKFSEDVIDLEKEGLGERIYSENEKPSIRSEEI